VMGNSRTAPSSVREGRTSLFMSSRQQTGRDFYRILGVNRNASLKEIKAAFRRQAKQFHPGALRFVYLYITCASN
jgi:preprotein translocase subunit Sec63